jgi:hypothetical protein
MWMLIGLAIGGIIFANIALPRAWKTGQKVVAPKGRLKWRNGLAERSPRGLSESPQWLQPMHWLAVRDGTPRRAAWRTMLALLPLWVGAIAASLSIKTLRMRETAFIMAIFVAYGMHLIVKVLIAAEASRRMNEDRRSGAWELLLVTPLKIKDVLIGQKRALRNHFGGVMNALWLTNVAMAWIVLTFGKLLDMDASTQGLFCEMFFGGMIALFADFYGLSWVGMWRGLTARQHHRAVLATLGHIMSALPLIIFFLIFTEPNVHDQEMTFIIGFVLFVGILVSLVSGVIAKTRLMKGFRAAVLASHQAETPAKNNEA